MTREKNKRGTSRRDERERMRETEKQRSGGREEEDGMGNTLAPSNIRKVKSHLFCLL